MFLSSAERRFSVPAMFVTAVAHSLDQDWPQATGEAARSGLDAGEHDGSLIEAGI